MQNANNKFKKLNGKLAIFQEPNNYLNNKRLVLRNLLDQCKDKDSLLINQFKMPQYKKLTNKFKSYQNKLEKRKMPWLLNYNKRSKFYKNSKLFKTNTKLKSNHFQV